MDNPPDANTPLVPSPQRGDTGNAKAPGADAGPPIFAGPVSLWLGFRTFLAAGFLELLGWAGTIYGVAMLQPSQAWVWVPSLALALASGIMAAYMVALIRSLRYKITRRLIECEHGLLVKRVDSVDLGRVKDIELRQTLLDRMLNIGTIEVFSSDKTEPILFIEALPNPRPVYEKLRDAVIEISQKRGVIPM